MVDDSGESLIEIQYKAVIKMARERIVKYPPKRGKLKRSEMRRVVRKVVHARRSREEAKQTQQKEKK